MGHKGYHGQYTGNSKFSKKRDEDYDAKEAYNKNLKASARLHYLENLRHDHDSPATHPAGSSGRKQEHEHPHGKGKLVYIDQGQPRMSALHNEQGDFDYENPNYRETKEYKRFQRKQKRQERKIKRKAAPQKHCM
jgi:hypothetical protein